MPNTRFMRVFISLATVLTRAMAAIGPVTDLQIVNADVAPDGFTRSAVLSDGVVDTNLITGQKVGLIVDLRVKPF